MKKLVVVLIVFFSFSSIAQQKLNQFKFDDDKYFFHKEKKSNIDFKYTVDIRLADVEVISTDSKKVEKFRGQGRKPAKKFGKDKSLSIVAIPTLYNFQNNTNNAVFMFGLNGAEGGLNSAEVTVTRNSSKAAGSGTTKPKNQSVKVDISASEFYLYPNGGALAGKKYLYLKPDRGEKMEISIKREPQRGLVYVCIFDKNGKLIKALDPKFDPNALSFVVNETVYVVPVISPTAKSTSNISFEVGDPKEVARLEIEEE